MHRVFVHDRAISGVILVSAIAWLACNETVARAEDEVAAATALADAGESRGYYELGRLYELGRGVDRDLFEAARQYQLAAEGGHAEAQYALGLVLTGALPDSPRSARKSFHWFDRAARQGHPMAAYFLAMSYETGAGTAPNGELAFEWYRRAASRGSVQAISAVARMYASGTSIRLNLANAHAWNQLADARGFDGAQGFASELESRMTEKDLDLANKLVRGLKKKYSGSTSDEPL